MESIFRDVIVGCTTNLSQLSWFTLLATCCVFVTFFEPIAFDGNSWFLFISPSLTKALLRDVSIVNLTLFFLVSLMGLFSLNLKWLDKADFTYRWRNDIRRGLVFLGVLVDLRDLDVFNIGLSVRVLEICVSEACVSTSTRSPSLK